MNSFLSIGLWKSDILLKNGLKYISYDSYIVCIFSRNYLKRASVHCVRVCISSSYLFCNASRPIVCRMFYVSSRERCTERIVRQPSVGILYQDTVSSHANSESNLRMENERCRESKVPRMYANTHKLGIVVVLTRSSSNRSRCDWTDCWRDFRDFGTDKIGILHFRMSKHPANPLIDQFWRKSSKSIMRDCWKYLQEFWKIL